MRNPLTRTNGTESDSRARTAATPTDLPQERAGPMDARARQREEFGGFSFGSVFFGWLVAIGLAVLLTAVLTAAGTAVGITELDDGELSDNAETIGLLGAILLFAVLFLSYYAGGYVAGRLARFDGARQGFGVWILGVLVTAAFAALAALAGSEWNVFEQLDLPRIPIDEGTLTTGGAITLAAIVIGSLLAAIAGGKVGERFHRKVDRFAFDTAPER
jgi:MFS family permease